MKTSLWSKTGEFVDNLMNFMKQICWIDMWMQWSDLNVNTTYAIVPKCEKDICIASAEQIFLNYYRYCLWPFAYARQRD